MTKSVVCVGEIMLELSGVKPDGSARFGFGGDTGNTAIYLSRLFGDGGKVGYLTRLGQGPFSDSLAAALGDERVQLSPCTQLEPGTPGLYAISTDADGERSFTYWRRDAAVRQLLTGEILKQEIDFLLGFDALYLSGITLAVLSDAGRAALFKVIERQVSLGRDVMFDVNYRPHLWQSHVPHIDVAQMMKQVIGLSSVVKIGQDESEALFGSKNGAHTVELLKGLGDAALVITDGPECILAFDGDQTQEVTFDPVAAVVDSTAAGDSFSAGFLHSRMYGESISNCVKAGQRLAAEVIRHPGAIMPLANMPA